MKLKLTVELNTNAGNQERYAIGNWLLVSENDL